MSGLQENGLTADGYAKVKQREQAGLTVASRYGKWRTRYDSASWAQSAILDSSIGAVLPSIISSDTKKRVVPVVLHSERGGLPTYPNKTGTLSTLTTPNTGQNRAMVAHSPVLEVLGSPDKGLRPYEWLAPRSSPKSVGLSQAYLQQPGRPYPRDVRKAALADEALLRKVANGERLFRFSGAGTFAPHRHPLEPPREPVFRTPSKSRRVLDMLVTPSSKRYSL